MVWREGGSVDYDVQGCEDVEREIVGWPFGGSGASRGSLWDVMGWDARWECGDGFYLFLFFGFVDVQGVACGIARSQQGQHPRSPQQAVGVRERG